MKILFLNNGGSGFADYVEVSEGTDIQSFINKQLPDYKPGDLLIRVNRQPVARDYVLREGDRVSATPTKIEGAAIRGTAIRRVIQGAIRGAIRRAIRGHGRLVA